MTLKKILLMTLLAASPYVICSHLVFIFMAPILYLLYSGTKLRYRNVFVLSLTMSLLTLLPIIGYSAGAYLLGAGIVALFLIVFIVLSEVLIKKTKSPFIQIVTPAVIWTSLVYILNFKSLMSVTFDIGVLFPVSAPLVWYIGSTGLTFLIILFNSSVARYLVKKDKLSISVTIILAFLFIGSFTYSMLQDPAGLHASDKALNIALIQGDAPGRSLSGYEENLDDRVKRYIALSEEAVKKENPQVVVWPEYTLPVDIMKRFPEKMKPITSAIKESNTAFIIGSMASSNGKSYDAAFIFNKKGELEDTYYSEDPAIFNKSVSSAAAAGKLYFRKAGITVCWEELNAGIFRNYVKNGAEYFISLSSNADLDYSWFKNYASFFSRIRAAENARYLARATQTGITEIVSPFGRVIKTIPKNKAGFLTGKIYGITKKTFYSKHGDIIPKIILLLTIFAGLVVEMKKKKPRIYKA